MAKPTSDTDSDHRSRSCSSARAVRAVARPARLRRRQGAARGPRARAQRLRGAAAGRDRPAARVSRRRSPKSSIGTRARRPGSTASGGRPKRTWRRPRCATRSASTPRTSGNGSTTRASELLGRLRGELRGVGDEIARLAEVQGLIGGAPKRVEPLRRRRPRLRRRSRRHRSPNPSRTRFAPPPRPLLAPPTPAAGAQAGAEGGRDHPWPAAGGRDGVPQVGGAGGGAEAGRRRRPPAAGEQPGRVGSRRSAEAIGDRRPAAAAREAGRAGREQRRSSAASAARSTGRPSGTASAAARSSPASERSMRNAMMRKWLQRC